MKLSFTNVLVRYTNEKESLLSVGEQFKYSVLFYLILKKFMNTNFEIIFTVNNVFDYLQKYYLGEICSSSKSDKYKRQKSNFKLFLKKMMFLGIYDFYGNSPNENQENDNNQLSEEEKIKLIDDSIDSIGNSDLIRLSFSKQKEEEYKFCFIYEDEVETILRCKHSNIDKIKLFNVYADIANRVFIPREDDGRIKSEQHRYCRPLYDDFIRDGILSRKDTLKNYLDILKELNLIRFESAGQLVRKNDSNENEYRNAAMHYILVRDYPNYSNDDLNAVLKDIIDGYKKAVKNDGWKVIGSKKSKKKSEESSSTDTDSTKKENDTWGESAPDDIEHSEKDMDDVQDALIVADDKEEEQRPINKFSFNEDDLFNPINPEVALIKEFLGKYSFRYEKEFEKINEGALDIAFFFNGHCNDGNYSDYLKFKESKSEILPVKKSSLTKHIPTKSTSLIDYDYYNSSDDGLSF